MKKKMTHTGIVQGDARNPNKYKIKLRETSNFWVTASGVKYRKNCGWGTGNWPLYSLDITTVVPIPPA